MQKAQIKDVLFHWIPLARQSAKRFPLTILTALLCTAYSLYLTWNPYLPGRKEQTLFLLSLGIALFTAIALLPFRELAAKFKTRESVLKIGANAVGVALLTTILLTHQGLTDTVFFIRLLILLLIVHLAVATAPFLFNRDQFAFWRYNQALFARAILTVAYAGLLFAGIAVGIWSLDPLFAIKFESKIYLSVWCVIAYLVSVLFFLAAVPEDPQHIEEKGYPSELRILVPNVALPLIAIYLGILYVYAVKIAVTRIWPEGKIGWLISSLSFVIVLANLLVFPIGEDKDRPFVRWLNKNVYRFLLPLMIILFLALFQRVKSYGWTEARFALFALSVWTTFIALASIGRKRLSLFWVPASLLLVCLVVGYSPLNMFQLSERSQVGRLKSLLEELKYSGNGKTGTFATAPTTPQRREMTSTLEFVCKRKGGEALKTLLNVDFTLTGDSGYGCEYDQGLAAKALRSAGTFPAYNYGSGTSYDDDKLTLSFAGELKQNLSLKNQGLILNEIKVWDYTPKSENGIQLVNKSEATKWNVNSHVLTLMLEKQPPVSFDLKLVVKALRKESPEALDSKNTFDPNKLNPSQTQPYIVENESGTLVVRSIRLDTHPKSETVELTNLDGLVLTKPTSQPTDR